MTGQDMRTSVDIKKNKWTINNDVDVIHEGGVLVFDLNQDFRKLNPRELALYDVINW